MSYQFADEDGSVLDAHFDVEGNTIVLHSRGGSGDRARNVHYSAALRLMLGRLSDAGMPVKRAWVDSGPVQGLPLSQRIVFDEPDWNLGPAEQVTLMASRMQAIGRRPSSKSPHGNATKRIRLQLDATASRESVLSALKAVVSQKDFRSADRLPASDLAKITPEHLWGAVQRLLAGHKDHGFDDSTEYDLLLSDGTRLPPKAVFGIAASEALGFPVLPKHFSAGLRTPCFRQLAAAGYRIVPKAGIAAPEVTPQAQSVEFQDRDAEFAEGTPQLRSHLRRERSPELREAKKAEFRRTHAGRLLCEKCGLDPVKEFESEDGEACIEVHHDAVQVQHMGTKHFTKLSDLKCLCANCHRFVHRLLRKKPKETQDPVS